jgi:thioredoxin reductase (NADPH)
VRGEGLEASMSAYLIEQLHALENVELHTRTEVRQLRGSGHLESASFAGPDGDLELPISAVFVVIGQQPRTAWLEGVVERDDTGFILTGSDVATGKGWNLDREPFLLESSLPGLMAAGDVRHRSVKRIASAVGEGSMAVQFVHLYLASV